MSDMNENHALTETIKASVKDSGVLMNLKQVSHDDQGQASKNDFHELKQQAQATAENIEQLLNSGKLDDGVSQKLAAILTRLRSAMAKGGVSLAALASALSEAAAAISSADSTGKNTTQQQITEQLWQKVEADNKDIDDDFIKMRKAGINFNEKLWNRHNELMEYLQAHPRDLKTQKELDAVDDALLVQAEGQMDKHPDAKPCFDDAKKKSKDRHEVVDRDLAAISKKQSIGNEISMADFDSDSHGLGSKLMIDDVRSQHVGQKPKSSGRQHG